MFIALNEGWNVPFQIFECELTQIHGVIGADKRKLVPEYLQSQIPGISTWFEIISISQAERGEINKIHIKTSGRSVTSSLRGATSIFRVGLDGDVPIRTRSTLNLNTKLRAVAHQPIDDYVQEGDDFEDISHLIDLRGSAD